LGIRKTSSPSVASDEDEDDTADFDRPEAHEIDWSNAESIRHALSLWNSPGEIEDKSMHELIVILANNFSPTDIRPVYMLTASKAGYDTKSLKMKSLKSMKTLSPELAKMSVTLINAMADIDSEHKLPSNITVK
jgi:hypothetical protein